MQVGYFRWRHERGPELLSPGEMEAVMGNMSTWGGAVLASLGTAAPPVPRGGGPLPAAGLPGLIGLSPPNGSARLNSSGFAALSRRVETARAFLQSLCACALGDVDGAGRIYDMLDRVSRDSGGRLPVESIECPDVPAFLCRSVVRPQLNGQVKKGRKTGGGRGSRTPKGETHTTVPPLPSLVPATVPLPPRSLIRRCLHLYQPPCPCLLDP
jgi:hypothetical protein